MPFIKRIGGFFGVDTHIFPPDRTSKQPSTTVGAVLNDLYGFRNIIAHGKEIPVDPYGKTYLLKDSSGCPINLIDYYYEDLMYEAGLFLLTTALRRIFVEKRVDEIIDRKTWKKQMTLYEKRYQQQCGSTKQQG